MKKENWTDAQGFDNRAQAWDASAVRAALADAVARAIVAHMPVAEPPAALEFGAGTGLVTLRVAPHCGTVTAIDTSSQMLQVLQEKIADTNIANIRTRMLDLSLPGAAAELGMTFDFAFSSMTLHHIPDTQLFLATLCNCIRPGGMVAIADLDSEDGSFHDNGSTLVHYGFERSRLREMFEQAGFCCVSFITAHTIEKTNRDGKIASYPVFLVTARKPESREAL